MKPKTNELEQRGTPEMTTSPHWQYGFLRFARDFLLGFALFLAGVAFLEITTAPASSFPLTAFGDPAAALPAFEPWTRKVWAELFAPATQARPLSLAVLGLAFATMTAFNLGLLRHLRRAYASPRSGAWRRG